MGPQIVRLLALLRPNGIANSAAQTGKAIHAFASQAPIGLTEIAAAPVANSVPLKTLHSQRAPKFLETSQVKSLVKQLLQPIGNSQASAPLPIVACQVGNPTAVQNCARSFGTIVRSAISESNASSLRRFNLQNAYGKAGAFARNGLGRRFQYTDGRGVTHFRPRGFRGAAQDPNRVRRYLVIAATAGGVFFIYYRAHLEEVPYTHRKHFVAISPATERALGEQQFEQIKLQFAEDILPNQHPLTRRVRKISARIIEAAISGVEKPPENTRDEDGELVLETDPPPDTQTVLKRRKKKPVLVPGDSDRILEGHRHEEELKGMDREMMNEKIYGAPDRGGGGGYTSHLDGLKWEVIVVDKDILNAFCLPGGKIVVFTGLIKHFPNDTEIATVLGHEVGHVIGRHIAEKLTQNLWLVIGELVALQFFPDPYLVDNLATLAFRLRYSRKLESEADKIGLILMAAAGYDPRVAPHFYEQMAKLEGMPEYMQYLSTHPAGQARARALMQAKVMEEAVQIYERTLERKLQERGFRPALDF